MPPAPSPPPEPQAGTAASGGTAQGSAAPSAAPPMLRLERAIHAAEHAIMQRDARVHHGLVRIDARLQRRLHDARRYGAWAGVAALLLGGAWLGYRSPPASAPASRSPRPVASPAGHSPLAFMLLQPLFVWWAHRRLHPSVAAATAQLLPLVFASRPGSAAQTERADPVRPPPQKHMQQGAARR